MKFTTKLERWLSEELEKGIPQDVAAFAFNLVEHAMPRSKFGIELIGAGRFSPDDQDWPCNEVWSPAERRLNIPLAFSTASWETCQEKMRELLCTLINSQTPNMDKLKASQGIGFGFVDGDLEILWSRSSD